MGEQKMKSQHYKIVYEILPNLAKRLEKEGVISAWNRKQFKIFLARDSEPIIIRPDLVLHLPDQRRVLAEVINPKKKPKRFVGELVYPHILGHFRRIEAVIFFVLSHGIKVQKMERSMTQEMALSRFFKKTIPDIAIHSDFSQPEELYRILKHSLTDYQRMGKFY